MRRALRLLLWLALLAVAALVVNQVVSTRETKPARADIGRLMKVGGADVQVREDGPRGGPPIVLLHCFDCSVHWWTPTVGALARGHRVVRIDLLGHGGSAKPRDGYSMPNQARLVASVLDRLRVRSALVAGHSMGSSVTLALAERRPDLVRAVVLIGQPARPEQARLGLTARLGFFPLIGPALRRVATDSLVYDGLATAFAPDYRFPRSFVQDYRRMTYTSYDESGASSRAFIEATPLDQRLAATRKRALVVFGDREQIVDHRAAARSFRAVPRTDVRIVSGAGHSPSVERPAQTARLILDFDRRVRGGP
jgi:pimeloyl-ACP methyl ester carboxylesterase